MLTLLRVEMAKLLRAKSFYLSFAALSGFVALMLWGFYTYAARKTGGQATEQFRYTYESKQYFNGLTFALYSTLFAFTLLLPIFVAATAGSQVAGEARAGTLRVVCARPVSRVSVSAMGAEKVLLEVDGELVGTLPADYRVMPRALRVRVPA